MGLKQAAQQALEALEQCGLDDTHRSYEFEHAARVALRAALAQQEQEPVAWAHTLLDDNVIHHRPADLDRHPERWTPLYTAPPRCPNCASLMEQNTELDKKLAEWVGLTEEEIEKCKFDSLNGTGWSLDVDINLFYKSVEAKLKEKNT